MRAVRSTIPIRLFHKLFIPCISFYTYIVAAHLLRPLHLPFVHEQIFSVDRHGQSVFDRTGGFPRFVYPNDIRVYHFHRVGGNFVRAFRDDAVDEAEDRYPAFVEGRADEDFARFATEHRNGFIGRRGFYDSSGNAMYIGCFSSRTAPRQHITDKQNADRVYGDRAYERDARAQDDSVALADKTVVEGDLYRILHHVFAVVGRFRKSR